MLRELRVTYPLHTNIYASIFVFLAILSACCINQIRYNRIPFSDLLALNYAIQYVHRFERALLSSINMIKDTVTSVHTLISQNKHNTYGNCKLHGFKAIISHCYD